MQRIIVIGNLVSDVEVVSFEKNDLYKFRIADNSNDYYDDNNQLVKQPEFFNCEMSVKKTDERRNRLVKGKSISVEGKQKTSTYEKDEVKKYVTILRVDNLQFN